MMEVRQNRTDRVFFRYQEEFEQAALQVLRSGNYILGNEVNQFEQEFAAFVGTDYAVSLASGLDALWIAFRILGIGAGDEVIVQGNTYIASVMGITINGAVPVFTEPDRHFGIDPDRIEEKISPDTKAVLVVHLYGMPCEMNRITSLCRRYGLKLIEDCAQSHGACYEGRMTGSFGDIGCFSFYPSKHLGGFGDGGAIVTSDPGLAQQVRIFRNYGSDKRYYNKVVGANSRLDELQAALLRVKLRHIRTLTSERQEAAMRYLRGITSQCVRLPQPLENSECIWHQFVVRCKKRDRLASYLKEKGIDTLIHYPVPPHLSEAYRYLNLKKGDLPVTEQFAREVLSLPVYNGMTRAEQDYVTAAVNAFS